MQDRPFTLALGIIFAVAIVGRALYLLAAWLHAAIFNHFLLP